MKVEPALLFLLAVAACGPVHAANRAAGAHRADADEGLAEPVAGCGAYGTHDCQFVPRLGGDGRPGPVYQGAPRCGWRATPLGARRICRVD